MTEMADDKLEEHISRTDAVVCALGHRGVNSKPLTLVTDVCTKLSTAISASHASKSGDARKPTRFIILNSGGVVHPTREDRPHGIAERVAWKLLMWFVPPVKDSLLCAEYVAKDVGEENSAIEWSVVRPSNFEEDEVREIDVWEQRQESFLSGGVISIASVGKFMGDLAAEDDTFAKWKYKMPVISNKPSKK